MTFPTCLSPHPSLKKSGIRSWTILCKISSRLRVRLRENVPATATPVLPVPSYVYRTKSKLICSFIPIINLTLKCVNGFDSTFVTECRLRPSRIKWCLDRSVSTETKTTSDMRTTFISIFKGKKRLCANIIMFLHHNYDLHFARSKNM